MGVREEAFRLESALGGEEIGYYSNPQSLPEVPHLYALGQMVVESALTPIIVALVRCA